MDRRVQKGIGWIAGRRGLGQGAATYNPPVATNQEPNGVPRVYVPKPPVDGGSFYIDTGETIRRSAETPQTTQLDVRVYVPKTAVPGGTFVLGRGAPIHPDRSAVAL